eukprot:COSAG02_NODE_58296_length_278_cov_0.418994_1_plen_40_part_10
MDRKTDGGRAALVRLIPSDERASQSLRVAVADAASRTITP